MNAPLLGAIASGRMDLALELAELSARALTEPEYEDEFLGAFFLQQYVRARAGRTDATGLERLCQGIDDYLGEPGPHTDTLRALASGDGPAFGKAFRAWNERVAATLSAPEAPGATFSSGITRHVWLEGLAVLRLACDAGLTRESELRPHLARPPPPATPGDARPDAMAARTDPADGGGRVSSPARLESGRLAITAIGMATSLGDAVTACAAARAGLARPRPLPLFAGMDGEEPAVLSGHPCADVIGFEGFARLCYLTRLALEDLLTRWTPAGVPPKRVAVLINLPTRDERPLLLEHLVRMGNSTPGAIEADVFLGLLRPMMPRALQGVSLHVLHGGHAGGAAALHQAESLLGSRQADICVIGGVDSYLDFPTLEWLEATRQLKTPERPTGLVPGEGAAFLAVERPAAPRERREPPLALLGPLACLEEDPSGAGSHAPGEVLARALCDVLERNPERDQEVRVLIHDLNGQDRRAMEWGHALLRSAPSFPSIRQMTRWLPAVNFGDVGCATAPFQVCIAVRALARGYALGRQLLLASSEEEGSRAALIVTAPGTVPSERS